MKQYNFLEILSNVLLGALSIALIAFCIFVICLMVICVIKITNSRTKYEFYSLDGEKGYSYHCEAKEKVQCEVEGNMIEVSQFSEAE